MIGFFKLSDENQVLEYQTTEPSKKPKQNSLAYETHRPQLTSSHKKYTDLGSPSVASEGLVVELGDDGDTLDDSEFERH